VETDMKIRHIVGCRGLEFAAMADTSSAVRGRISNPEGAPAAGTKVIILHRASGTSRTVTTNESGALLLQACALAALIKLSLIQNLTQMTVNDVYLVIRGDTFS
jgi:hypothetical protein